MLYEYTRKWKHNRLSDGVCLMLPQIKYFQSLMMLYFKSTVLNRNIFWHIGLLTFFPFEILRASISKTTVSFQDQLDTFFGDYIVSPLAAVLFWPSGIKHATCGSLVTGWCRLFT